MRLPFNGSFRLTQRWGENPDIYARFGLKGHNGVDWALPNGTPVYAPHDGIIKERRFDANGYGNYLKIESDIEGSVLGHLQNFAVNINKQVKEGDLVGYSNNTGFSTGPHLHWGYYKIPRNRNDGYLGYINQLPLLEGENMSDMYKGLDLTNKESMKVAVNVWDEVVNQKLWVKKAEVEKYKDEIKQLKDEIASVKLQLKNKQNEQDELLANAKAECQKKLNDQKSELFSMHEKEIEKHEDKIMDLEETIKELKKAKPGAVLPESDKHTHPEWIYKLGFAIKAS